MTFARKLYQPAPSPPVRPATRRATYAGQTGEPIDKERAIQHAGYMSAVRGMPCMRCGAPPRSYFCHSDQGKGLGIKTDCRRGWPGCSECHWLVGTSGILSRDERRQAEDDYAKATRAEIRASGKWPMNLPGWHDAPK